MPKTQPRRQPVLLQRREWVSAQSLVVVGVDPGFAAMGIAVLEKREDGIPKVLDLQVAETKKANKKAMRVMRVTADDQRRTKELYFALASVVERYNPHAIAYEVYSPFGPQGGNAWKAARIEGMVQAVAFTRDLLLLPFIPQDLKMHIVGKVKASKADVQKHIIGRVHGLPKALQAIKATNQEHVADAAGYAYLAYAEMFEMRRMAGIAV